MTMPPGPAKRTPVAGLSFVTLALALAVLGGCRAKSDTAIPRVPTHPVIVVGIDGLEWGTVLEMLANGRLPTLAALMRRGSFGELTVTKPTLSPIIWTSIATGVSSHKHGILGFVHGEQTASGPGGRSTTLYNSNDRRVKAFWNILSDAGRRVHTIGWWLTYPVEPVNGVMVAQVNTVTPQMRRSGQGIWKGQLVEGLRGQVYPPQREPALLALIPEVAATTPDLVRTIFGAFADGPARVPSAMLDQSTWAFRADALYHRVALEVLRNDAPFDLFAVYFGGADVVGHRFWRHAYPQLYAHPPAENEQRAFGHLLESYYAYLDMILASLLVAAPPDANVLVVSDHGMAPVRRAARFRTPALSGGHLSGPPALVVAAGPDIRNSGKNPMTLRRGDLERIGSILDVTPTILALLDLPVGRDMDGDVARSLLTPEFRDQHPLRYVAAHTDRGWFDQRPKLTVTNDGATERIEQLRALGYLTE